MTALAGLLDVLLRAGGLAAFSVAVGGAAFALIVLRPSSEPSPVARHARTRTLTLIASGGAGLVLSQFGLLAVKPWALAESGGPWPVREFLATPFAIASLGRITLALALAGVAVRLAGRQDSRRSWTALALIASLLAASAAWSSHALGRLEGRPLLMGLDVVHQGAAAVWVGGLIHLLAFWLLWRRDRDDPLALRVLARFSGLAMAAVLALTAAGAGLAVSYVNSVAGLFGTGYGVMVVTKVILLAALLPLGALNFFAVRRARAGSTAPSLRIRWLVEAEIGLGITALLTAAALSSLPPAVDVREDRAEVAEVAGRFLPRVPRLASPPVTELLAAAAPITDIGAPRQPEEYAWSEYNHHVAGLFVLLMGSLACLDRTGRARWARHWPLLFLGLAAFMFVRNDPRAWPLGPAGFWETLVLPDVLQHRLAVVLVAALGVFEWLVRTGRLRSPRWALLFPLLCAAGGGLLLTHSHAMFNLKAEFLAEVAHTPLGLLGVFVGWGRWLELRLPPPDNRIPGRVWALSMLLLGTLLVFYREGPR